MTKDIVLVGVTVAYMDNALRPFNRRVITHTVTHGTAYDYLDTDLTGKAVYLNGLAVADPGAVIPQPGDVLAWQHFGFCSVHSLGRSGRRLGARPCLGRYRRCHREKLGVWRAYVLGR